MPINETDATDETSKFAADNLETLYEDEETRISLADVNPVLLEKAATSATSQHFLGGTAAGADLAERPYSFSALYKRFENSSFLRPNIDAYVTNIDSFGYHLLPSVDLASESTYQRVADSMLYEELLQANQGVKALNSITEPSKDAVEARINQLRRQARLEFMRLKAFFSYAFSKSSLIEVRRKCRQDLEVTGNAWWEILRNPYGSVCRIHYLNALNMYMANLDSYLEYAEPVETTVNVHHTDIIWRKETEPRTFELFVKMHPSQSSRPRTYYKEFGDPRVVSRDSGNIYKTVAALKHAEPKSAPATEVMHFKIFSPRSCYGIPRWSGVIPSVLGSIELDYVNYEFFDSNVIPPLALLVSGGRLGAEAANRIEKIIEDRIKGKRGINKILIIEARGYKAAGEPGPTPAPKLQFVPLRHVQQTDALFQSYDNRNEEKIAGPFRLPRILRGLDTKINRATAIISFRLAEEQIFEPEREAFDQYINGQLLPAMDIFFWTFRSNSPIIRDPETMSEMVERLVKVGILLPAEGRMLLQDIFNRQFLDIQEEWTNIPLPIILAQAGLKEWPTTPSSIKTEPDLEQDAPLPQPRSNEDVAQSFAGLAGLPALGAKTDE